MRIARLVQENKVSLKAAREKILPEVMQKGVDPEMVMNEKGLAQVSDDLALQQWITESIKDNPKVVQDFKSGKESAAMFLVGQVMKKSQGKANPGKVKDLLLAKLKEV